MKLSTVLVEIGAATPSVLEGVIGNEFATATEAVKRAACTGAREVLNSPPPALFHPSKMPTSYFLYGSQVRSEFDDVPFKQGKWQLPCDCNVVGAAMMDVCTNVSCPALIYVERENPEAHGIHELTVLVPEAPLAAMEADFFYSNGPPSAFERQFVGQGATSGKKLRSRIGKYVQSRGGVLTPSWLLNGEGYYLTREGPLAMLRLRKPTSDAEEAAMQEMLSGFRWENARTRQLKHLIETQGSNQKVKLKTVFCRSKLSEAKSEWKEINDAQIEDRGEMVDAETILENGVLGSLALLLLKNAESEDYYDVNPAADSLNNGAGVGTDEDNEDNDDDVLQQADSEEPDADFQTVLETVLSREHAQGVQEPLPSVQRDRKKDGFEIAMESTTRLCDLKKLATASNCADELVAVAGAFFSPSDAQIVKNETREFASEKGLCEAIKLTARMLSRRQGILCIWKDAGDAIFKISLCLPSGEEVHLALDEVTRLALLPWIVPLVISEKDIHEVKISGVAREKLQLSEASRFQAAQNIQNNAQGRTDLAPELKTALASLGSLPQIQTRLDALEKLLKQRSGAGEAVSVAPEVPASSAPSASCTSSSSSSAPSYTPDSPTTRALKRTIANIEAYEASQAAR